MLSVITLENLPEDWAILMYELGSFYRKRIKGLIMQNQEKAIGCFEAAETVWTKAAHPESWAILMQSIGEACIWIKDFSSHDMIEYAIGYYECALEILDKDKDSERWRDSHTMLGHLYSRYSQGNPETNSELSIEHYEKVISALKEEDNPRLKASLYEDLGNAYVEKLSGDNTENLSKGIEQFEKASALNNQKLSLIEARAKAVLKLSKLKRDDELRSKGISIYFEGLRTITELYNKLPSRYEKELLSRDCNGFIMSICEFLSGQCTLDEAINFIDEADSKMLINSLNPKDFMPSKQTSMNMENYWRFKKRLEELKEDDCKEINGRFSSYLEQPDKVIPINSESLIYAGLHG
jgi:tetratricopeptide (TPR) repeat protein